MRTGFVSLDRLDYQESIRKAEEFGFDFVEIMMDGDAHRERLEPDAEEVRGLLEDCDVDLLVHFPYPMLIGSPHRHQREGAINEVKRCIDIATDLGGEKGVLHPDSYGWTRVWTDDAVESILVDAIRELDSYARDRGFEICVENLRGKPSLTIHQFDAVLSETEASMTFDTGHAAISGLDASASAAFLSEHRDRVSHVHLNDTRHDDVGYQGMDEHLPLGYGALEFDAILEPLIHSDWSGTLSIELDSVDFDYLQVSKDRLDRILGD